MRQRHAQQRRAFARRQARVGGARLREGHLRIGCQKRAQAFVVLNARQEMLGHFDAGNLARRELGGQFGHAKIMQIRVQNSAHPITFGTRNSPFSTAGALTWLASR